MKLLVHLAFNLLANAVFSFVFSLGIVVATAAALRVKSGRAHLALMLLPFAKVLQDLARGISPNAFFWYRLSGAHHELGSFRIGGGIVQTGPVLEAKLDSLYHEHWYPLSAGDLLDTALTRKISPSAPGVVLLVLGVVTAWLVVRRAHEHSVFVARSQKLRETASHVTTVSAGRRRARLFVSPEYEGPPFAGGFFRPYVVFSSDTVERLTEAEQRAVLGHELAHIARFDVLLMPVLVTLSSLFWFLPGCGWLVTRIRAGLEIDADDGAVRAGADPVALASALVTVAEALNGAPVAALAAGRTQGSLAARAVRLLDPEPGPRQSPIRRIASVGALGLVGACIFGSLFFGNHETPSPLPNPPARPSR